MSYVAALAAYRHGDAWLAELVAYLEGNRDAVARFVDDEVERVGLTPVEGTYLAWLDVSAVVDGNPHQFLLEQARVAVNDGAAFGPGGEGFVRLNFACPRTTLLDGLRRIRDALHRP